MPRAQANKAYSTLSKGLITEAGPLTFPPNASIDELNCDLFTVGNRKRRLGFNLEPGFSLSSQTIASATWGAYAINTASWNTVGGNGNLNFLVLQIGPTLYFYDQGRSEGAALSDNQKSFTVNLNSFAAPGAVDIGNDIVQMDSGKGLLFVVGKKIESFFIEYDSDMDTISTTQIDIMIRDFDGVSDGLDPDEEPATLSNEHSYNLKNQGWVPSASGISDPVSTYNSSTGKYPPNSKQWWQGKDSNEDFNANLMRKMVAGNTEAPKGSFILEAFYKDRSDVSGVSGIAVDSIDSRPRSVAFFSGRVWYAGLSGGGKNGDVYFSQILTDTSKVGKCYQQNDPTSEDLSDLLASDGGVIIIPEAGTILSLFVMRSSLIVMADNGIWSISGRESGFRATDFSVDRVSSIGIDSPHSVVDVEGTPIWWGKTGINTIAQNEITDKFDVQSISKDTIQTFYDSIPSLSKVDCKGVFDQASRKVYWIYREEAASDNTDRFRFTRVLVLDTRLGAFYPWKISTRVSTPYYIASVFTESSLNSLRDIVDVIDGVDNILDGTDQVVSTSESLVGSDTFINFLAFQKGASTVSWTFGNFTSEDFLDWSSAGTGVSFDSYFETGNELLEDLQRKKQATYVHVLFNRTETAYTDTNYNAFENPSSCLMQARWEWSDNSVSGKYSPSMQVYRLQRGSSTYTPSSGTDFNSGFPVSISRNKIRGSGKALRLRFSSEEGKDFDILGWAISFSGNTSE